eukprot:43806-Rhodomonas_salina.1
MFTLRFAGGGGFVVAGLSFPSDTPSINAWTQCDRIDPKEGSRLNFDSVLHIKDLWDMRRRSGWLDAFVQRGQRSVRYFLEVQSLS